MYDLHRKTERDQSKMPIKEVISFLIIFLPAVSVGETTDHQKLLGMYVSVCGMKLCNASIYQIKPEMDYNPSSSCPNCKCDDNCWLNHNCCPDLYLSFPLINKVKTNVFPIVNGSSEDSYAEMISTCPSEQHACEIGPELADLLNNVPVFAGPYNLPFRSDCYARCNGYDVTRNWFLDIDCDSFYDLNFCSTFQEISDVLHNAKCTVKYSQDFVVDRVPTTDAVIGKCNRTGFWNSYDVDVEKACAHVGPEMGKNSLTHSNVFCYMCNPSQALKANVISTCNVTGKWEVFDQGLKEACEHYPVAHTEQPYKNWFCRMCNQNNSDPFTIDVLDGSIKITYDTVADWDQIPSQQYDLTVQHVDIENIINDVRQGNSLNVTRTPYKSKIERILENKGEIDIGGSTVNITNLLYNDYLRTGSYDICATPLLDVIFTQRSNNCSCDVSCIFNVTDACCPDVKLLTKTKCIDQFELSTSSSEELSPKWLAIDECPVDYTDDVIVHLCQNVEGNAAYQLVPVESKVSKIVFRNIYCAFCHLNKDMHDSYDAFMTKIQFYTLRVVCPLPIPFQNEISLESTIYRARAGQCRIQYVPANIKVTCDENKTTGQCNKFNVWNEHDADIQWACENTDIFPPHGKYENIFCAICNPMTITAPPITSCNMTGKWLVYNSELDIACQSSPVIQQNFPFKNGLCERCNKHAWSRTFTNNQLKAGIVKPLSDLKTHKPPRVSFRTFFTTYNENLPDEEEVPQTCKRYQIYDAWKKKCRDVKCNPGRHLYNGTCKPLLETTTNLSYSLSLSLESHVNHSGVYITDLLEGINMDVRDFLSQTIHVNFGSLMLSSFLAMSHVPCPNRSSVIQQGEYLNIFVSAQFDITNEFINRFESEKTLVDLPGKTMDVKYLNKVISFKTAKDPKAFTLPVLIRKTSLVDKCFIKHALPSQFSPHRSFKRSHVTELLQCKQIYLDADEFMIDEDGMTLTFAGSDAVIKFPEFEIISNGQVRICASELPSPVPIENVESVLQNALRIFTLALICLSLICLSVTFIPYFKFDYLRTLPGLNTVALMMSLFLVQLMFIIQSFTSTDNDAACAVLGILMHAFWLVYFAWTGVGTFHMYRLFVSDDYFSDDRKRYTTLRHYAMFTIVFALIVVALNIILTAAISAGESIGYGGNVCFITFLTGKVLSFIVPIIIILIWNALFFIVTYRYIRGQTLTCKKVLATDVSKNGQFSLKIFRNMFILSGFTWFIQLIDGFLPLSVFSFIVTLINASQGMLILYIHRKGFTMKKGKRRPGSTYRGSTFTGLRSTTTNSSSTRNISSSTSAFRNRGFDSNEETIVPRTSLVYRPSSVSVDSKSKIINHAEDGMDCNSFSNEQNECDSIENYTAPIDDIGSGGLNCEEIVDETNVKQSTDDEGDDRDSVWNNKAECESIASDKDVKFAIEGDDRDSVWNNKAECESIASDKDVKFAIDDEMTDSNSEKNGITPFVKEEDIMSLPSQGFTEA